MTNPSIWPMYGGNAQHSGLSPYNAGSNPGEDKWSFRLQEALSWPSPSIGPANEIIACSSTKVIAISQDGQKQWEHDTGLECGSPVVAEDGTIYVHSGSRMADSSSFLYAIGSTGIPKWGCELWGWLDGAPTIGEDGTIYVISYGNHTIGDDSWEVHNYLYSINRSGEINWMVDGKPLVPSSPAIGNDGNIYVGTWDGHLVAYSPSGELVWDYIGMGSMSSTPVVGENGNIYVASTDRAIHCISNNGEQLWVFETSGMPAQPSINYINNIFFGCSNGDVYSLDEMGNLIWNTNVEGGIHAAPALSADGLIFIGAQKQNSNSAYLYALNHDGSLIWRNGFSNAGSLVFSPIIGNDGTIFIGSTDNIYAIGNGPSAYPIVLTVTICIVAAVGIFIVIGWMKLRNSRYNH